MLPVTTQQKVIRLLGQNGHRLTSQKQTVLKILFEHDRSHLTVEEIYGYAKEESSRVSIATIYKTISFLEQENVLHKIRIDNKSNCYELIHPNEPEGHPHCICTKCCKTIGIVDESVTRMLSVCEQAIKVHYHFQINLQDILYYGLCEECRKKS
ncbi:MAG: Fur family transcriptional regulator [Ethanoligenens sp.]